jgi:hypothetical protein
MKPDDFAMFGVIGGVVALVWLVWFSLSFSSLVRTNKAILEALENGKRANDSKQPAKTVGGLVLREG